MLKTQHLTTVILTDYKLAPKRLSMMCLSPFITTRDELFWVCSVKPAKSNVFASSTKLSTVTKISGYRTHSFPSIRHNQGYYTGLFFLLSVILIIVFVFNVRLRVTKTIGCSSNSDQNKSINRQKHKFKGVRPFIPYGI